MLDTETTGLNCKMGDRVIEIGCVEVASRNITDRHFHRYLNPERDIDEGAVKVHGLTREFLSDKPKFAEVAKEFVDYIRGAEVVIHNAAFDVEFLDSELARAKLGKLSDHVAGVVDSLAMARELFPGKRNSLDALCERFAISNAHRTLHGALLDARLLAEVYLALTRGQDSLVIDAVPAAAAAAARISIDPSTLVVLRASEDELKAHEAVMDAIDKAAKEKGGSLWRKLAADAGG